MATTSATVFDANAFYSDFMNFYNDNNESYDISEVFDWYFDQHIFNTEKYNAWFKYFFPTVSEVDEERLYFKLFQIIGDNIEDGFYSENDTDCED